jgi:hypothetical protein
LTFLVLFSLPSSSLLSFPSPSPPSQKHHVVEHHLRAYYRAHDVRIGVSETALTQLTGQSPSERAAAKALERRAKERMNEEKVQAGWRAKDVKEAEERKPLSEPDAILLDEQADLEALVSAYDPIADLSNNEEASVEMHLRKKTEEIEVLVAMKDDGKEDGVVVRVEEVVEEEEPVETFFLEGEEREEEDLAALLASKEELEVELSTA